MSLPFFEASFQKHVSGDACARHIDAYLEEQGLEAASVECPDRPLAKGDRYTCEARMPDGAAITVDVEQADDEGSVNFVAGAGSVHAQAIAEDVQRTLREELSRGGDTPMELEVDCGRSIVVERKGETLQCTATAKGESHDLVVTLDEPPAFDIRFVD